MSDRGRIAAILALAVVAAGAVIAVRLTRQARPERLEIVAVTSTTYGHRKPLRRDAKNIVITAPRLFFSVALTSGVDRPDIAVELTISPPRGRATAIRRRRLISVPANRLTSVILGALTARDHLLGADIQTLKVTVADTRRHETQTRVYRVIFIFG